MDRGRILIMGQTKENTYELRNLLDSRRFELEIALNQEVGKLILSQRSMNLLILHTEMLDGEAEKEFFGFLNEQEIDIPVFIVGEETERCRETLPGDKNGFRCFEKPYPVEELMTSIDRL